MPTSGTDPLTFTSTWKWKLATVCTRWQSYCPRCHRTWVRRNERSGRRSFRRHMELVHGVIVAPDSDEKRANP